MMLSTVCRGTSRVRTRCTSSVNASSSNSVIGRVNARRAAAPAGAAGQLAQCINNPFRHTTVRSFGLKGYGWPKDRNFPKKIETLMRAKVIRKPPWYETLRRLPPIARPIYPTPPKIVFPEDAFLKEILKRNPLLRLEMVFYKDGEVTIAQRMAERQLRLTEMGQDQELAYHNMMEEFQPAVSQFERDVKPSADSEKWTDEDFYEALSWKLESLFQQRAASKTTKYKTQREASKPRSVTALDVLQSKMEEAQRQMWTYGQPYDKKMPQQLSDRLFEQLRYVEQLPTTRELEELKVLALRLQEINQQFLAALPDVYTKEENLHVVEDTVLQYRLEAEVEALAQLLDKKIADDKTGNLHRAVDPELLAKIKAQIQQGTENGLTNAVQGLTTRAAQHEQRLEGTPEAKSYFQEKLTWLATLTESEADTNSAEAEVATDVEEDLELESLERKLLKHAGDQTKLAITERYPDFGLEEVSAALNNQLKGEEKTRYEAAVQEWRSARRRWLETASALVMGRQVPQHPENIIGYSDAGLPVYIGERGGTETANRSPFRNIDDDVDENKQESMYPLGHRIQHQVDEYKRMVLVRRLRMRQRRDVAGLSLEPPERPTELPKVSGPKGNAKDYLAGLERRRKALYRETQ